MADSASGNVLFFIPDISGYTKFISETEISHSQHIIQNLLEGLVDSNSIGLKVSEFEGDAVLFYRHGDPPALKEFIEQARKMFVGFHTLLKKIELSRICQCGACAGASGLTLKIVAHTGPASTMQVKDHVKFIGKDIIVAHRLLKNSVADREYLLLSRGLLGALGQTGPGPAPFQDGADTYDELGTVEYRYLSLSRYRDEVKVEPPEPFTVKDPLKVMELTQHIKAPAKAVFAALTDLPGRMKWIDGIKEVKVRGDAGNYIGQVHRCIREGGDPDLVTSGVKITDTMLEFSETDSKKMASCTYVVRKAGENACDVAVHFFVRGNFIVKLMFSLLMEKKLMTGFERSLANLRTLLEKAPH